jgi:YegS/Rv2252/BmrU family lipid kinase
MKIAVILNPSSGFGRAKKILPKIEKEFVAHHIDADIFQTKYKGHGEQLAATISFDLYDGLVAAGGDGTLFEVINGYMQNPSAVRIPLGVLPIGTGNAFSKDLALNTGEYQKAIRMIARGKTRKIDIGYCRNDHISYYFINIAGLGFVSDVNATAQKFKWFGNVAYSIGVFLELIRLKSFPVSLVLDGKSLSLDSTFIEVSNTRYTSNFLMAPHASIEDGLLDVTILKEISRKKLVSAFPKIFTGDHIFLDEVETYQVKEIHIHTQEEKIITPDGELIGSSPVTIRAIPAAVEFFYDNDV